MFLGVLQTVIYICLTAPSLKSVLFLNTFNMQLKYKFYLVKIHLHVSTINYLQDYKIISLLANYSTPKLYHLPHLHLLFI